jgi:hypothetical protein
MKCQKSMKTYLLLHPNYASPLLNEKAITLLPEIRLEVGLQWIGICAYWKRYQTYKLRIFPELLEGLGQAGAMEVVEDRLMTKQMLIYIGNQAGHGRRETYRSSVCRSDSRIEMMKAGVLTGRGRSVVDE